MAINKVIYGGTVLMDITDTTATAADVADGKYFYEKDGIKIQGSSTKDSDTTDATALASEILNTKTAYVNKNKITGEMPNRGAISAVISTLSPYTVPNGYHDGSGTVSIDASESAKIIAGNIKSGVEILGVTGTYTGQAITAQSKTVTPTTSQQLITADVGYDYLSQVTVNAISYTQTDNAAGGKTVTIAATS